MLLRLLPLLLLMMGGISTLSFGFELQPLATRNLSPVTLGFGLPALGPAKVLQARSGRGQVALDLVSNSSEISTANESLAFDGETYRVAFSGDYGIGTGLELGFDLPLLSHQGGFLDSFIEGWHDTFGLPQGTRDQTTANQLEYSYARQGGQGFGLQSDSSGIGDLSLRGAWQLLRDDDSNRALALRAALKLPTGSTEELTGSGSTDLAIWISGEQRLRTNGGQLFLYGGGGGLISSDGDLLADQRRNLVGFVSLGCGWQPWTRLGLQLQFDGHSPFYRQSSLGEIADFAGQLAMGGSLALGEQTVLELAVVEDIIVATAPDVVFHLALSRKF